jgi:TetR/AcrR family fatty acid metabolism transcriptional regulator
MRTRNDQKRISILKAAGKVFPRKGFHQTLMDDIAREAGIGKGTIYRYFHSKEDLFFNILDNGMDEIYNIMLEKEKGKGRADVKLQKIMESMADFVIKNRPLLNLMHEIEGKEIMKRAPNIHAQNKKMLDIIAKVLKEGAKEGRFRKGNYKLWAVLMALASRGGIHMSPAMSKEKIMRGITEVFFNGILEKKETLRA